MPNVGVLPRVEVEPNAGAALLDFAGVPGENAEFVRLDPNADMGELKALVLIGFGFANGEELDTLAEVPNAPKPSAGLKKDGVVVRLPNAPVTAVGTLGLSAGDGGSGVAF